MNPDQRPPGGSIVVREAPPSIGGGLRYLCREPSGRAAWTMDASAAERHPSLREASRAALTAPPLPGAMRPAYAVPVSVADPAPEPSARPGLRLVAAEGEAVAPDEPSSAPESVTVSARAEWPLNPTAWFWMAWAPWIGVWRALLFREGGEGRR